VAERIRIAELAAASQLFVRGLSRSRRVKGLTLPGAVAGGSIGGRIRELRHD